MENIDIIELLKDKYDSLSKRQKLIAEFVINNYAEAADMTAAQLSETVDVSESTVVRFAQEIGFEGYQQMQRSLRQITITQSTSVKRMEITKKKLDCDNVLSNVLKSDIRTIERSLESIDNKEFDGAVNAILNAKNIYISGVRSAQTLATFTDFYLRLMFDNTKLVKASDPADMFEQVLRINEGDVIIGISFPRYSKNIIKVLEYAKSKGATIVGITDSYASPISKLADFSICAGSGMDYFADSLVAPLSVINALITALGIKNSEKTEQNFEDLENIWAKYEVYDKE